MNKVAVIGFFCTGNPVSDGQSIKTRIVTEEIERLLGSQHVRRIDTYGWRKHPLRLFFQSIMAVLKNNNVIFMTDEGGIRIFPWLLRCANIFGKCKIHYVVVGGWLPQYIESHLFIESCLKKIACIYVETSKMKCRMEERGFSNIVIMPNCKLLNPIAKAHLNDAEEPPYKLCTFSRVMKEKGIEDAVEAVCAVNQYYGKTVYTLDIFGQVDPEQTAWFEALSRSFPQGIRYGGVIPFDQSVAVLKDYFALIFPTRFYTEGIPGTIIDAYSAGVPVIASQWESYADIVDHNKTGISYPFADIGQLKDILVDIVRHPDRIYRMCANCLEKSKEYLPEETIAVLMDRLDI